MLDLLSRLQDINVHVITLPSNIFVSFFTIIWSLSKFRASPPL